jgi:TonB family protein
MPNPYLSPMKRLLLSICLSVCALAPLFAQNFTPPEAINLDEVMQKIGYPMEAKSAHVSGKVLAKVKVTEAGRVASYEILESPSPVLSKAVESQIDALRFKPAKKEGVAVSSYMQVPFRFELSESAFNDLQAALRTTGEVESLDLSGKGLTVIDSRIPKFASLRVLNLDDNKLTAIPASFSKLRLLQELSLANNQLTSLPKSLKKLKHLKVLDISGNQLSKEAIQDVRDMLEDTEVMAD